MQLTLWGRNAEVAGSELEMDSQSNPVLSVTSVRITDYNGEPSAHGKHTKGSKADRKQAPAQPLVWMILCRKICLSDVLVLQASRCPPYSKKEDDARVVVLPCPQTR